MKKLSSKIFTLTEILVVLFILSLLLGLLMVGANGVYKKIRRDMDLSALKTIGITIQDIDNSTKKMNIDPKNKKITLRQMIKKGRFISERFKLNNSDSIKDYKGISFKIDVVKKDKNISPGDTYTFDSNLTFDYQFYYGADHIQDETPAGKIGDPGSSNKYYYKLSSTNISNTVKF